MTSLERQQGGELDRPTHGPGRPLGMKRKPQLRLGMGYKHPEKGYPVKTDYFVPRGNENAVAKFKQVYGDQPRAIDIRLPSSLGQFLDIKHMAFVGGQNEGGGIPKAFGRLNYATEGVLGGPDVLTVYSVGDDKKLQTEEIEISSVDDAAAKQLGVQLYCTVTFGIPDVLGSGGMAQLMTRGGESIDTLWSIARYKYGLYGPHASIVLRPKLILKQSRMLTPGGTYAPLYVLDLYFPESEDEELARVREYRELTGPGSAALYGPRPVVGELGPDSPAPPSPADASTVGSIPSAATGATDGAVEERQQAEETGRTPAPVSSVPGGIEFSEPEPGSEPEEGALEGELVEEGGEALMLAAAFVVPSGQYGKGGPKAREHGCPDGMTLAQVLQLGDDGRNWLRWALRNLNPTHGEAYLEAVWAFAEGAAPDLYQQVRAEKETQS